MSFLFASPYMTVLDSDGNPVSGAKLYFYATGTTTPAAPDASRWASAPST